MFESFKVESRVVMNNIEHSGIYVQRTVAVLA